MPAIRDDKTGQYVRQLQPWSLETFDDAKVKKSRHYLRYVVYLPEHPRANAQGDVLRSIAAYEAYYGVTVPLGMEIHHINGDTLDDSKENLQLLTNREHQKEGARKRGSIVTKICAHCGKEFEINAWRLREDPSRGTYCGQECFHAHPRKKTHKENISRGLKRAYKEGRRVPVGSRKRKTVN